MIVPYGLLEKIIWIEILFVVLLIAVTYLLRFYFYLRAKHDQRITKEIEDYLERISRENKPVNMADFPGKWRRLEILLPLIFKMDTTMKSPGWTQIKDQIAEQVLLPIARKKYKSYRWMNRLLCTECFGVWMDQQDEDKIAKLLDDKIPIVHLHATVAAIKFGSVKLVNLVINSMSRHRRLGQAFYLSIFELANPSIREMVEDRLKTEKDYFVRATCYKILMTFKEFNPTIDVSQDIQTTNIELRLAAMRYAAFAQKNAAIPLLVSLLSDPQWEIRAASNRLLGDLHASDAITDIANGLKDKNWWVRVNAATTLKNFGEAGIQILKSQNPEKDKYAFETAMHVLNQTQPK